MRTFIGLCLFLLFLTPAIFATVGGPEEIEVLGWNPQESKAYFLRVHYDASDRAPDLITYDVLNKRLIIEKEQAQNSFADFDQYYKFKADYHKFIEELKSNLKPLLKATDLRVALTKYSDGDYYVYGFEDDPESKVNYWKYLATIYKNDKWAGAEYVEVYDDNKIETLAMLVTPDKYLNVVILRYKGIPFEGGYNKDKIIFIPKPQERAENIIDIK